eukprot:6465877-Amphidinium_carterae.1
MSNTARRELQMLSSSSSADSDSSALRRIGPNINAQIRFHTWGFRNPSFPMRLEASPRVKVFVLIALSTSSVISSFFSGVFSICMAPCPCPGRGSTTLTPNKSKLSLNAFRLWVLQE